MGLGNPYLTAGSVEQNATEPGMAFFAHTGPIGMTCGDCRFRGYWRRGNDKIDPRTQLWVETRYRVYACEKYKLLTGIHGPSIKGDLPSCKYFEAKPK